VYGWGVLDREVYLALLIVILMLLGLSFLGKIRFKGSSHANQITVPRLIISIAIFSFAAYLVPGMWGAPLKAVSGYLPQVNTQDFRLIRSDSAMGEGMSGYYDYSQALERSEKVGKPVFLYFTGKACIDCRKMEAKVFSDARVQKILRERYLLLVMYADVRYDLREDNWVITPNGKILKSVGKINTNILITKYGVTEMPCCLLLDSKGNTILPPRGYDLNINAFIKYLERGLK
jgi:thioredoxin-related protein